MKFFVPAAKDEDQAERVYSAIKKFSVQNTGWDMTGDRIYSLKYTHEGKSFHAKVGEREDRTNDLVLAILKSNAYLICTENRGGVRGEPILVGSNEVTEIEYFE